MNKKSLDTKKCLACEGGVDALTPMEAEVLLKQLEPGWHLNEKATEIQRTFNFKNYYETMAFVNAIAWMAHEENHHPDLSVHYNHCVVKYNTHAIQGLSENDFICAAKIDKLFS